jgi:hypothetical protein
MFGYKIENFSRVFSRLFLIWIRSISILTLIVQIQTLISISNYARKLHKRRKLLINQLHTIGHLFVTTIQRQENRPKSKNQKTLKRLRKMYAKTHSRARTL